MCCEGLLGVLPDTALLNDRIRPRHLRHDRGVGQQVQGEERSRLKLQPGGHGRLAELRDGQVLHERDQIELKYMDLRSQYNQVKLVRDNL